MRSGLLGAALVICLLTAWGPPAAAQGMPASAAEIARGKYVFGATGGCGCHTVPKGQINAGGRRYDGPFGTLYSSNITPDRQTGIGTWTDDQIIALEPARAVVERVAGLQSEFHMLPDQRHEIFNEIGKEETFSIVAGFVERVTGTGG